MLKLIIIFLAVFYNTITFSKDVNEEVNKRTFCQNNSKYFHTELKKIQAQYPEVIKEVRGVGLLIGSNPARFLISFKELETSNPK